MNRKAIFGGTFDPIHNGHINLAYETVNRLNLDKIIFMPSGNPPHKTGNIITDANLRYEMINMVIRNEKYFELSSYEINNPRLSFTYKTMEYYSNLEPTTEWYFLTGADCLMEIDSWKNVDRILKSCKLVVFNRPGYSLEKIIEQKNKVERFYNSKITLLTSNLLAISSTTIRNFIKEGKNVSSMIPQCIENVINEIGLYRRE
jgi:nicotinate-nucleotide adenylyltransferase